MVLEGDERKSKTRVAAEPEFKWDVEIDTRDDKPAGIGGGSILFGEERNVTNHVGVAGFVARGLGKFVPDVEPVAVVLVDALATDFNFDVLDEDVAEPIQPAETIHATRASRDNNLRDGDLEVHAVHEITVTGDRAGHALAEISRAVERLFDGFHGEVGVATVNHFKEGNLRVAGKIDVLSTISDQLHKTSTHCIYL